MPPGSARPANSVGQHCDGNAGTTGHRWTIAEPGEKHDDRAGYEHQRDNRANGVDQISGPDIHFQTIPNQVSCRANRNQSPAKLEN